jgi:hypothetical protein
MSLGAVTIDLDSARCYHAIHGLPPPPGPDPLVPRALPRFLDLCDALGIRATLFCVGQDVTDPAVANLLRQAHQAGHELASHSHTHDYRLGQQTPAAIRADLDLAADAIQSLCGQRPVGFRAPGYNLGRPLARAVQETGHAYDSSMFPSWPYFLARAATIFTYAVGGTPSRSLVGHLGEFRARRTPFRPSAVDHTRPARRREPALGLWEFPIGVATPLALPMVGTFLPLYPSWARRALAELRSRAGGPLNLELHALDFAERADGLDPFVVARQPGMDLPLGQRVAAIRDVMATMRRRQDVRPLRDWVKLEGGALTGRREGH